MVMIYLYQETVLGEGLKVDDDRQGQAASTRLASGNKQAMNMQHVHTCSNKDKLSFRKQKVERAGKLTEKPHGHVKSTIRVREML